MASGISHYEMFFWLTAYCSIAMSAFAFLSGLYALWYDWVRRRRLKQYPLEYAALVLSTTVSFMYVFMMYDWFSIRRDGLIGYERNLLWMIWHNLDRLIVWLFHTVLIIRVLKTRGHDARISDGIGKGV